MCFTMKMAYWQWWLPHGNVLYNEHGISTKIVTCKLPTPPRKTKGRERKEERMVVGLGREC